MLSKVSKPVEMFFAPKIKKEKKGKDNPKQPHYGTKASCSVKLLIYFKNAIIRDASEMQALHKEPLRSSEMCIFYKCTCQYFILLWLRLSASCWCRTTRNCLSQQEVSVRAAEAKCYFHLATFLNGFLYIYINTFEMLFNDTKTRATECWKCTANKQQ